MFWIFLPNIARGTTDPEINSVTWIELGNNMSSLTLVANLVTRWRHLHQLQIWPPHGATYFSCKFSHQMAPLALVANLATRWHHLHWFQSWPPGNVTCIATLPWIALLALSVSIEFVSSSARVTSVKFAKGVSLSLLLREKQTHRSDPRDTWVR